MEQVVRKGYLVENGYDRIRFDTFNHSVHQSGRELLVLYNGNGENFKFIPDENNNSSDVSTKIQELLQSSGNGIYIGLISTPDTQAEPASAWIAVMIDEEVLTKLYGQLIHPKISVRGRILLEFSFSMSTCDLKPFNEITEFEGAENILRMIKVSEAHKHDISFLVQFSVLLEWTELKHQPRKKLVLSKLLSNKLFANCSIITGDGKEVSCHKSILAASSGVFHAMLTNDMRDSQSNKIEMTELTEDVVNQLLAYLYEVDDFNPKELKEEMAFELLKAAHQYNISGLEQLMLETLLDRTVDIFDMNLVLELYLFTENVEGFKALCDKMEDLLRRKPNELAASSGYLGLLENNPMEAANLTMKLLKMG